MNRLNSLSEIIINSIKRFLKDKRFIACIVSTFVVGIIAHGYMFANLNLSHDSLNEFYAGSQYYIWKIQLARYFTPIYSELTGTLSVYPWSNGLLGLLWIAIALYFVVKTFDIKNNYTIYFLSMLLAVNKTVTAILATYSYEFSSDMFAMMLATASAYIWSKNKGVYVLIGELVLLIISLATYQAYISVYLMIIIVVSINNLIKNKELKYVIIEGVKGLLIAIFAIAGYYIIYKFVSKITGIYPNTGAYNSIDNVNTSIFNVTLLVEAYLCGIKEIFIPSDSVLVYTYNIINLALVLISIILIIKKSKSNIINLLLVLVLLLCIPLVGNAMHFLSGTTHDLMYYSFYIVLAMPFILFEEQLNSMLKLTICVLAVLLTFYNIQSANAVYVKRDIQKQSTFFYVTDIISKLEEYPEYHKYDSKIAIVGELFDDFQAKELNRVSLSGSSNIAAVTYYTSWKNYIESVLNYPINIVSEAEAMSLAELDEVKAMPIFPTDGSIKMIDDVIVIKLQWK